MVKSTGRSVRARISLSIGIEFSQCTFNAAQWVFLGVVGGGLWMFSFGGGSLVLMPVPKRPLPLTTLYSQMFKSILLMNIKFKSVTTVNKPSYTPSSKHREIHLSTDQKSQKSPPGSEIPKNIGVGTFVSSAYNAYPGCQNRAESPVFMIDSAINYHHNN